MMTNAVKKIDDEKYKVVEPYLKRTLKENQNIENPYFIYYNDNKYFVCEGESSHLISTINNNNEVDLYTYFYNSKNVDVIIKNNIEYVTTYQNDFSYALKINLDNFYTEKLRIEKTFGKQFGNYVYYIQEDLENDVIFQMRYDTSELSDEQLKMHLSYISGRMPDIVCCKNGNKKSQYKLTFGNLYNPFLYFFKHILIDERKEYELSELMPDIDNAKLFIPEELIKIYNNKNQELNEIKEISNIYKRTLTK